MRDIIKVIDDLLAAIPETESDVQCKLSSIRQSALYTAPEAMYLRWQMVGEALTAHLPFPPVEPWQHTVATVFMGTAAPEAKPDV